MNSSLEPEPPPTTRKVILYLALVMALMTIILVVRHWREASSKPVDPKVDAAMQRCFDHGKAKKGCLGGFVKFKDGTIWQFRQFADMSGAYRRIRDIEDVVPPGHSDWEKAAIEDARQFVLPDEKP